MSEIERIHDRLRRIVEGDCWHGPALREILQDVSAPEAHARPIPGAHTIWELVLHIGAWAGAVRMRLGGERAELSDGENFPTVTDASQEAWEAARSGMEKKHRLLAATVAGLDESRLDEPLLEGMTTLYNQLHGLIEHSIYHAGQLMLLKRALESRG